MHRHIDGLVDLQQGGLVRAHGRGLAHLLRDFELIGVATRLGADIPHNLLGTERHLVIPAHFARFARRQRQTLARQGLASRAGVEVHAQRCGRCIAHGKARAQLVAFAHEGRQARQQDQVLRAADVRAARAEQFLAGAGNRDDAERRQGIVERHLHRRFALGVELDGALPEQQGVEQFAAGALAAATAGREGLAAEVALADHLHLRRRRFHLQAALRHHGI